MFEKLATWYLSRILRKAGIDEIELVIRDDGWTYRKRNKLREELIKQVLSKIK